MATQPTTQTLAEQAPTFNMGPVEAAIANYVEFAGRAAHASAHDAVITALYRDDQSDAADASLRASARGVAHADQQAREAFGLLREAVKTATGKEVSGWS